MGNYIIFLIILNVREEQKKHLVKLFGKKGVNYSYRFCFTILSYYYMYS